MSSVTTNFGSENRVIQLTPPEEISVAKKAKFQAIKDLESQNEKLQNVVNQVNALRARFPNLQNPQMKEADERMYTLQLTINQTREKIQKLVDESTNI